MIRRPVMAKGTVNKAIVIGRLGADPEVRYTPSGSAVANFNIATNRMWKDRDGNMKEETTWHKIVLWARLAEVAKEYARKGSRVYIEGRLQTRDWEDQNGQKRYVTEIVGENFQLLDSRSESSGDSYSGSSASAPQTNFTPPEDVPSSPDDVPF